MTSARKGKIASLPRPIRDEVCRRLDDGQSGSVILPWLNAVPQVVLILADRWDGKPITDQNLTEWRQGGFRDWLESEARAAKTRALADLSFSYAKASGGDLSEGALAAAVGRAIETLESLEGNDLNKTLSALAKARAMELKAREVAQNDLTLAQRDRQLSLEEQKFRRTTADLFLKWYGQEQARQIAEGKQSRTVKMDQLVQLMFGDRPSPGSGGIPAADFSGGGGIPAASSDARNPSPGKVPVTGT